MLTNSLRIESELSDSFGHADELLSKVDSRLSRSARLPLKATAGSNEHQAAATSCAQGEFLGPFLEISPADAVRRRALAGHGAAAEIIQVATRDKLEVRFCAPVHLLVISDRSVRQAGETFLEGLPRSTLRNLTRKLTFVPAGHHYQEWQEPRTPPRLICVYFDPDSLQVPLVLGTPRLHFEDAAILETALKLQTLIENPALSDKAYLGALCSVLAHELMRLNRDTPHVKGCAQGGLAPWQQRIITSYIEQHLAEQLPLATLAQLVGLSSFYFCRAFKQSFELPPHRYHIARRIQRAKALLVQPGISVTEIGLTVGFSDTSAFTAAFRKATGITPTTYRRSLT
jgi:AraC family transcriptional regulator